MNDLTTIELLCEGDENAFRSVFDEYHMRVYAYVMKKTGSEYIAEEAMQITFVKLWKYRRSLKRDTRLFTQVFRIASSAMIDLIRIEANKRAVLKLDGQPWDTVDQPIQHAEANDLGKHVNRLIRQMPTMQQKVFEMSRIEEKTHREIAFSLSISVKTVETHISRAIKFLRQNL